MANAVNARPSRPGEGRPPDWAKTVFVSTEYVFDGEAGPYDEDAEPRPLSVYGSSKAAGEQAVLSADPDAIVVRTTVVYGPERQGRTSPTGWPGTSVRERSSECVRPDLDADLQPGPGHCPRLTLLVHSTGDIDLEQWGAERAPARFSRFSTAPLRWCGRDDPGCAGELAVS